MCGYDEMHHRAPDPEIEERIRATQAEQERRRLDRDIARRSGQLRLVGHHVVRDGPDPVLCALIRQRARA